jgi:menaquinone-dependent protoporphyrinogen oxidase
MGNVLVVFATKTGCTREVAERIGAGLTALGQSVDVIAMDDKPDPAAYDAVVVGSGVRAGQWHAAARDWVVGNGETLAARPTALFTVCMTVAAQPEKIDEVRAYTDPVLRQSGVQPLAVGLFAGFFLPERFGLVERTILKAMKTPQGDFRDWIAIDRWAAEVGPLLCPES